MSHLASCIQHAIQWYAVDWNFQFSGRMSSWWESQNSQFAVNLWRPKKNSSPTLSVFVLLSTSRKNTARIKFIKKKVKITLKAWVTLIETSRWWDGRKERNLISFAVCCCCWSWRTKHWCALIRPIWCSLCICAEPGLSRLMMMMVFTMSESQSTLILWHQIYRWWDYYHYTFSMCVEFFVLQEVIGFVAWKKWKWNWSELRLTTMKIGRWASEKEMLIDHATFPGSESALTLT